MLEKIHFPECDLYLKKKVAPGLEATFIIK